MASRLGLRSTHYTRDILNEWTKRLSSEDLDMLCDYHTGTETPDEGDPFPELGLEMDQTGLANPLLVCVSTAAVGLHMAKGKTLYRCCVEALNRKKLNRRKDTVWRQRLKVQGDCKPVWRLFYKPPLNKKTGDLQWRILHRALAVNYFVSKINPIVSPNCPFCPDPETVFHCFLDCKRLSPLFKILKAVSSNCGVVWSEKAFIFGAGYSKEK